MGVKLVTEEIKTSVAPSRMFHALVLDSHNLLPKLIPQIKRIEFVDGDGGVGSIKVINFSEESKIKSMKQKIEALDKEKLTCKYTVIESDMLEDKLEKIVYEVSFCANDNGSIYKINSEIYTNGDNDVKDEEIKAGQDKAHGLYKAVEEHLTANPSLYA